MTYPGFTRLSESPLWAAQRAYFEAQGPRAWTSGTVPHYVTCNPMMARAYAGVIAGFAADCARARAGADRTLYIVELGAGSGRLAWNLVRALRASVDTAAEGWRVVYVLTDIAEATLAWWQAHPRLAPLIAAGELDVARFDATRDRTLALRGRGVVLDPARPAGQLVVVANYVFDGLPHDVYASEGGALHECLVDAELGGGAEDGVALGRMRWVKRPAPARVYADPVHQRILDEHARADGVFGFPCAALGALDRLRALSAGPLLVLSADKGSTRLADVMAPAPPAIATHGSVSMPVNYVALGAWALAHGGAWLHNEHRHRSLEVCAFVLGGQPRARTLAMFERAIAQHGPDDFFALKRLLVARSAELTTGELLAYLRLSGHDAKLLVDCAGAWRAAVGRARPDELEDLARALARVWEGYLPIDDDDDEVGALVAELAAAVTAAADAITGKAA